MADTMLFPALLKYWRGVRGMSQLDLSLAADVSSRHLSFLETGRSKPSEEMVLRLGATLDVPLREQNALLGAAGFEPVFHASSGAEPFDPRLHQVISRMMDQQEPYPLLVMNRHYEVVGQNAAGLRLFAALLGERAATVLAMSPLNVLRVTFDTEGLRPEILNWDSLARQLLTRVQREVLQNPADSALAQLLDDLLASPGVPDDWQAPDFSLPSEPTLPIRLGLNGQELEFLTTLTVFSAPQNVDVDELHIESWFPADAASQRVCEELADAAAANA